MEDNKSHNLMADLVLDTNDHLHDDDWGDNEGQQEREDMEKVLNYIMSKINHKIMVGGGFWE